MKKYDYYEAVADDVYAYLKATTDDFSEYTDDEMYDILYDDLWPEDRVTGNGPYGYADEEECAEYVASNLTLYFEAADEFDDWPRSGPKWVYTNPAQHMDATIRCYVLGPAIERAMERFKNEHH